jgi:excinuclease ABC subunit C
VNPNAREHIEKILTHMTQLPGVYKMLGKDGELLYVGKAKNLKNRVSSYFVKTIDHPKTQALVARIYDIESLVVRSETEALLLEQNLIKLHRPPYNIMLRDDKSYVYIFVSADKPYPRIASGRGKGKHQVGKFFGPYPSAYSARDTLLVLQKLFNVRQCENSYFSQRKRPCLQYQIKRCTAPCVGLISPIPVPIVLEIRCLYYKNYLMSANVKTVIFHNVNALVYSIRLNVVQRLVSV